MENKYDTDLINFLWKVNHQSTLLAIRQRNWEQASTYFKALYESNSKYRDVAKLPQSYPVLAWLSGVIQIVKKLAGHVEPVLSVAFSYDGHLLVSGSTDLTVKVWDVETGQQLYSLIGHKNTVSSVTSSPADRRLLASGSYDKTIKVWEIGTEQPIYTLKGHKDYVHTVAFSPDGELLASGGDDGIINIWEMKRGYLLHKLPVYRSNVYSVTFSPDGRFLASAWDSDEGYSVRIWERDTNDFLYTINCSHAIRSIAFSPDGRLLASGGPPYNVTVWSIATKHPLYSLGGDGKRHHKNEVESVAFSPDGRLLVAGRDVMEAATGKYLYCLQDYGPVYSQAFSPDGRLLASGGEDNMVRIGGPEV